MRRMAILMVLVTGCLFGTSENKLLVSINLNEGATEDGSDPVINAGPSLIQVVHRVSTSTRCYNFSASASQTGNTVDLVVEAIESSGGLACPAAVTVWQYNALITGTSSSANRLGVTLNNAVNAGRKEYPIPR